MNKFERLLYILNLIRTHRGLTASQIAEKCEVTERTVFRDITALSSANIPIYYDRGYKLLTECFLPTLNFDLKEYLVLREVMRTSPLRKIPQYSRTMNQLRAKIDACLAPQVKEEKRTSSDGSLSVREESLPTRHANWFGQIEEAISDRKILHISYDSIDSGIGERDVEPYFTVYVDGKFYFVGYCLLRQDFRTFRIGRLKSLDVTGQSFSKRSHKSAEEYFENSFSVFSGEIIDIVIEFSGKAAKIVRTGSYVRNEEKQELQNGKLRYSASVSGIFEVARWLMGFGSQARVIQPETLRTYMVNHAKSILETNSGKRHSERVTIQ